MLEVEFALVISRMIDSVKNNPEDLRQVIYDLARYKLREQLPHANAEDTQRTQQALEIAIRGVEAFSEKRVHISQLNGPGIASTDRRLSSPESFPQVGPSSRLNVDSERKRGGSKDTHGPWPHPRRTAAMIAILVAILLAVQQREPLLSLAHNLPKLAWKSAIEERSTPSLASNHSVVPAPPPARPAATLRPIDYGVYAISNDALIELSLLPIRPPDIRVAISAALTIPSRTILPNGHPKFIVFRRDLASSADRAEVRMIAKVAREFSPDVVGKKPSDGAWVIRNISFPFRSSPVNNNPEMYELHSEDPALELPPGRYALVLKTQAYDFSIEGDAVDPRQCIERIVAAEGTFYSNCKKP